MNAFARSVRLPQLLAVLLVGVAGCGISDYQRRMDESRKWVTEFDAANRGLDDPIEVPKLPQEKPKAAKDAAKDDAKDADDAWLFNFYLRLPKGFGTLPKDKAPIFYTFPCFRYAGPEPGTEIFVAAGLVVDPKSKEKDEFGKYTPDNFRFWIRAAIKDYYAKANNKLELKLPPQDKEKYEMKGKKMLSPDSDEKKEVAYKFFEYSDKGNKVKENTEFRVYIHEEPATVRDDKKEPGKQIAIIVRRTRPPGADDTRDAFDKAIDASLGTLDTTDVISKRSQYKKLMKH